MPGRRSHPSATSALPGAALLAVAVVGLLGSGCGSHPEALATREALRAAAPAEAFRWSDTGPAPAFAAGREACLDTMLGDDFLRIQPPLNLAIMLRGCLEKRGWRFEAPGSRVAAPSDPSAPSARDPAIPAEAGAPRASAPGAAPE